MTSLAKWLSVRLGTKWLWVRIRCCRLNLRYHACFEQRFPWHSGNCRMQNHLKTCMWHDKNSQPNAPYRYVLTTQLNYLSPLAKWLSVRLRTKSLWVRVSLQSLKLRLSRLFGIQATTECIFTLERVCDMIKSHRQAFLIFLQAMIFIWLLNL